MQVVPAFGATAAALPAEKVLENIVEDVAESTACVEPVEALTLLRAGMSEHVVALAPFLVAQRFVGFVDFFKFGFGVFLLGVAGVQVRVVLAGHLAIGLL